MRTSFIYLLLPVWLLASCGEPSNTPVDMSSSVIMEVTTFQINEAVDAAEFAQRDFKVENDFTSKQPGFIKRQSGVDDQGNYAVVVFWENATNADASMQKFMSDASVADYAQMINASTMKMARYAMDQAFNAAGSQFVEIMSFDVKPGTDLTAFQQVNQRVETEFTGNKTGFLQRLTGTNESGTQVVAVYWDSKVNSDAALQPFMEAPIAQEFMQDMEQSTISMGRYAFLNK
ncbi:MAG: hypothetical protein AAFU60_06730 [Bacteroidota bacterium]